MAGNSNVLLETEFIAPDVPRLSRGFDVRSLASVGLGASGDVIAGLASRQAEDHTPETHSGYSSPLEGYRSILEQVRALRNTFVGKWATWLAMTGTTLMGAACGNDAPERGPAVVVTDGAEAGAGGGAAQAAGGGNENRRNIIGDPACYEGFESLSLAEQQVCNEAFNDLSLEQVTTLSSLDKARWAFTYRQHITGTKSSTLLERYNREAGLNNEDPLALMTSTALDNRSEDIAHLAWFMQRQPEVGNDPRTWAALFGIGTTADSPVVADAKQYAEEHPAGNTTATAYAQFAQRRDPFFTGVPKEVSVTQDKDGHYTVTFTATHATRGPVRLSYSFYKFLVVSGDGKDGTKFSAVDKQDPLEDALGEALIGVPNA